METIFLAYVLSLIGFAWMTVRSYPEGKDRWGLWFRAIVFGLGLQSLSLASVTWIDSLKTTWQDAAAFGRGFALMFGGAAGILFLLYLVVSRRSEIRPYELNIRSLAFFILMIAMSWAFYHRFM